MWCTSCLHITPSPFASAHCDERTACARAASTTVCVRTTSPTLYEPRVWFSTRINKRIKKQHTISPRSSRIAPVTMLDLPLIHYICFRIFFLPPSTLTTLPLSSCTSISHLQWFLFCHHLRHLFLLLRLYPTSFLSELVTYRGFPSLPTILPAHHKLLFWFCTILCLRPFSLPHICLPSRASTPSFTFHLYLQSIPFSLSKVLPTSSHYYIRNIFHSAFLLLAASLLSSTFLSSCSRLAAFKLKLVLFLRSGHQFPNLPSQVLLYLFSLVCLHPSFLIGFETITQALHCFHSLPNCSLPKCNKGYLYAAAKCLLSSITSSNRIRTILDHLLDCQNSPCDLYPRIQHSLHFHYLVNDYFLCQLLLGKLVLNLKSSRAANGTLLSWLLYRICWCSFPVGKYSASLTLNM